MQIYVYNRGLHIAEVGNLHNRDVRNAKVCEKKYTQCRGIRQIWRSTQCKSTYIIEEYVMQKYVKNENA